MARNNAIPGALNLDVLEGAETVGLQGGPREAQATARQVASAPYEFSTVADTTYIFVLADSNGKVVKFTNAGAVTVTVPPASSVAFKQGCQITCQQSGAGQVTFGGAGVTINSPGGALSITDQYGMAVLIYDGSDVWTLAGAIS